MGVGMGGVKAAEFARDPNARAALRAEGLSDGHSDAQVEDKPTFVRNAKSESLPDGKKSATNLHVLTIWQKQGGEWKLLARVSTRL
jgi:ketosteroid isomerase-like protein